MIQKSNGSSGIWTFWLGFPGYMDLLASRHSVDLLCLLKVKWMINAVRLTGASDPNHEPPISQGSVPGHPLCATTGSPLADHGKKNVPGVPRARGRGLERLQHGTVSIKARTNSWP